MRHIAVACCVVLLFALAAAGWQASPKEQILAGYGTSLGGRTRSQRDNARRALGRINGLIIPAGAIFSFNRTVGSYSRDAGYRKAPVSYDGELVDDWGGGVCQASTTLYNAALVSGFRILERTPHQFCPSYISPGRDAAVAYPSIDLSIQNPYDFPVRIRSSADDELARVDFIAGHRLPKSVVVTSRLIQRVAPATFTIPSRSGFARVRNSGKFGCSTEVIRSTGSDSELISEDSYPVMNRLVETRSPAPVTTE